MSAISSVAIQEHTAPSMLRALERVLSPSGFPYGSNWELFRDAHFGRDAIEVAEDLLAYRPDIAHAVICRLAVLQGTETDPASEEEPGKIHHEHRARVIDGHKIRGASLRIFRNLAKQWRIAETDGELDALDALTYYGTVDATPLYVRLVGSYVARYGTGILDEPYTPLRFDGHSPSPTIRESVRRAVCWIVGKLQSSDLGLLEFQRLSSTGARFQAWKDGFTAYLHPTGRLANYEAPIASVEVQGLAYDALTVACRILPDVPAETRQSWLTLRDRLQRSTLDRLWMPDQRFFAMAIDRDPNTGRSRQVQLLTSNAGALLDSGIFDSLAPDERSRYITGVVERIFSDEFLTPVGIRCSSLRHASIPGYASYQSSYTVWHKETYDIAKGLRRQGYSRLGEDLENRLLNAVNLADGAREFLYVMPDNRVDYRPTSRSQDGAEEIVGTNVPENDQAWSIAAALAVKHERGRRRSGAVTAASPSDLEAQELREHPPVHLYRSAAELEAARAASAKFWINTSAGWAFEREYPPVRI